MNVGDRVPLVVDQVSQQVPYRSDLGEAVRAVVQRAVAPAYPDEFTAELIAFCGERIAGSKCPRSVVFVDAPPRLPPARSPGASCRQR